MKPYFVTTISLLFLSLIAGKAQATWSVAAMNETTGTIAVAGASCSYMVYGIAQVLPGKGVVIVQAASNEGARAKAAEMLEQDASLSAVLATISDRNSAFEPAQQQYALLSFKEFNQPQTFSGSEVAGAKGSTSGPGYSVQANTMVSDDVVTQVAATLGKKKWQSDLEMAQTVMRAMNAGAKVGGDSRCKGSNSTTAFISLHKKEDNPNVPWLTLTIFGMEAGTQSAMQFLNPMFDRWVKTDMANPSTRSFVIPDVTK
ncbi:MAG: DUF1028 domain-containing protein [Gammaproteobacteria bacterium]|nr:DUF1028 domain-containing protein [Gammaproteobacteria bacterium]MBU2426193.1 DUF1028 domain-containing protein [Gammaproteobacteria bacterium]